ncbi:starch phosphorylase [Anaerospora hongkongensis]|uniref:Alpha-1,4 glucan phosphorylase n=1 Tax=Anaerospora hongkongensis TaxID=244830 RepID=A0A4R1Q1E3_9FIRM|nr:glycogen/starch/alpha-glucan phosphorylase [Anaerospora hongkongensis]TCL38106.1 starch phosphorylase [Anaerospora hongkongensis]
MFTDWQAFRAAFLNQLQSMHGKSLEEASPEDKYTALAVMVREYISNAWVQTNKHYENKGEKQVYYFSIEFLIGRLLGANLLNIGVRSEWEKWLAELGIDLNQLENEEPDAGLGNGGLGRLAACFLDSMASLQLPCHGCGIRYKYGLFEQKILDGYQVEHPDNWLKNGCMWEIRKFDKAVQVKFGGTVWSEEKNGKLVFHHDNAQTVLAVPYDIPVIGYQNSTVNTLRLWSAETVQEDFDLLAFNQGNYVKAVEYKYSIESISEILYPDDSHYEGRVLRLKQQYFLVSAGLQSIVRRFKKKHGSILDFAEKISIHINDTHPAMAIPELMRILMDEEGLSWNEAWQITKNTIAYTNHTILPEALEKWPVDIMKSLLPRIFMIIEELNKQFCSHLWSHYPGDWQRIASMAIIADNYVHMAHLAVVGSYSINGVAKIHTNILKQDVMKNFYHFYPYKFNNKTNGITHRRWLLKANPDLARLITNSISPSWIYYPQYLSTLLRYSEDAAFLEALDKIKETNKMNFANWVHNKYGITIDGSSIFDVHVKRIHAYKRQLMNALRILELYTRLKENPNLEMVPRTFIFAGKAAPGYFLAKRVIKLITTLAAVINNDSTIQGKMKVLFLENYSVSLAEMIFPAADVSEQISTASKEASGTGNMKFMMNGAVTIGTLDGANIEIHEEVGDDNIVIFGLTAKEVMNYYQNGGYRPWELVQSDTRLRKLLDQLVNGSLPVPREEFRVLYDSLVNSDEFFVLKDYAAYVEAQEKIDMLYRDNSRWNKMCLSNIAHSGKFSSDRTISEYAIGIWKAKPVVIGDILEPY